MCSVGLFVVSGSSIVTECLSKLPLDWLVLDREAVVAESALVYDLMALKNSNVRSYVRVSRCDRHEIERALDLGAQGIIVPKVDSRSDALVAVEAAFYPPRGNRGINPVRVSNYFDDVPGYLNRANNQTSLFVQIESKRALDNLEEIAAVPGLSGLFIGCGDLASSLGQPGNVEGAAMDQARRAVLSACTRNRITPGIFAYTNSLARQYRQEGFDFIALGNDLKSLRAGAQALLGEFGRYPEHQQIKISVNG